MPLVQLTTSPQYYPTSRMTAAQKLINDFANELPGLLIANATPLHLDDDTPAEAVQVTRQKFTAWDVNTPDLWILIQFTESNLTTKQKLKVRNRLRKLILGCASRSARSAAPTMAPSVRIIARDAGDIALIERMDGNAGADQLCRDPGLEIGEGEDEVRLERADLRDSAEVKAETRGFSRRTCGGRTA